MDRRQPDTSSSPTIELESEHFQNSMIERPPERRERAHGSGATGEGGVLRKSGQRCGPGPVGSSRTAAACFPIAFSRTACMGRNGLATACRALLCSESW